MPMPFGRVHHDVFSWSSSLELFTLILHDIFEADFVSVPADFTLSLIMSPSRSAKHGCWMSTAIMGVSSSIFYLQGMHSLTGFITAEAMNLWEVKRNISCNSISHLVGHMKDAPHHYLALVGKAYFGKHQWQSFTAATKLPYWSTMSSHKLH